MDTEDVAHFAGHLEWCRRCQGELDDCLEMRAQLGATGRDPHFVDDLLIAEAVHREGDLLERLLAASARRRRTLKRVRLASLCGSALLFVAVVVASVGSNVMPFW